MSKIVILYTQPENPEAFETAYASHGKLVHTIPGLSDLRLTRFNRTLQGDGYYLMAELIFPDAATMKTGLRSPEMGTVSQDAQQFANLSVIMTGAE